MMGANEKIGWWMGAAFAALVLCSVVACVDAGGMSGLSRLLKKSVV
jgi:hypothetical protein